MYNPNIKTKARRAKNCSIILFVLLLLTFTTWQWLRPGGLSLFLLIVQSIPLLIFIPGIKKDNPRAYIGLCFVLLLYFVKGVEGAFQPSRAWFDFAVIALSVSLFISSMMTSRWIQQTTLINAETSHG